MGAEYSCFGNNTANTTKTMDEYKVESAVQQHADLDIGDAPKEEEIVLLIDTEKVPSVQGAVRGFLTRKQLEKPLNEAKEARSWVDVEKKYELIEQPLSELQSSLIGALEGKLERLDIKRPDDGVPTVSKPAIKLEDGTIYQGEWDKQGKQHGLGTLIKDDGSKITGCFKAGLLDGLGRIIESSGLVFEGQFKDGELNGKAKIQNKSGGKFDGEMHHGKLQGKGNEEWPDGTFYQGEYENGLRHGQGELKLPDGSHYVGNFCQGLMHGSGELSFKNGNKYEGMFKNNKMHGKGKFIWADGRKYQGGFKNEVKHGNGKMTWPDGKIYDGEWADGLQHGIADYTFKGKKGEIVTKKSKWESGARVEWIE
jgi:hypothetical protein